LEAEEEEDVVARRPRKMGRTLLPGGWGRWGGPQSPRGRGACRRQPGAVAVLEAGEEEQAERICAVADLHLHQGAADDLCIRVWPRGAAARCLGSELHAASEQATSSTTATTTLTFALLL
jgi:hypothetical protein